MSHYLAVLARRLDLEAHRVQKAKSSIGLWNRIFVGSMILVLLKGNTLAFTCFAPLALVAAIFILVGYMEIASAEKETKYILVTLRKQE